MSAIDGTGTKKNRAGMHSLVGRYFATLLAIVMVGFSAGAARAQSLSLVTSQAGLQSNDNVSWAQLGSNGSSLQSSFNLTSANDNNPITVNLNGANSLLAVSCPASSCSWAGSGMVAGDTLIWTSNGSNGGNGPMTVTFGHPQAAAARSFRRMVLHNLPRRSRPSPVRALLWEAYRKQRRQRRCNLYRRAGPRGSYDFLGGLQPGEFARTNLRLRNRQSVP